MIEWKGFSCWGWKILLCLPHIVSHFFTKVLTSLNLTDPSGTCLYSVSNLQARHCHWFSTFKFDFCLWGKATVIFWCAAWNHTVFILGIKDSSTIRMNLKWFKLFSKVISIFWQNGILNRQISVCEGTKFGHSWTLSCSYQHKSDFLALMSLNGCNFINIHRISL